MEVFSDSYSEARAKFLDCAQPLASHLESHVREGLRGAQGEELAIDIAVFGRVDAPKSLLLVSGTHGQEGFAGSALQLAFLQSNGTPPPGMNIVVLHALNPWGFSHLSRTDEQNIDVNRNFIDFSSPLARNVAYDEIHAARCPDEWDPELKEWRRLRKKIVADKGFAHLLTAATGGQYHHATGMNYGGQGPSWSRQVVTEALPRVLKESRRVGFIEWHTGMGAYGEMFHVCMHEPGSKSHDRVAMWWGTREVSRNSEGFEGSKGAVPSYRGPFSVWLAESALPHAEVAGSVIEVGTVGNAEAVAALGMDRWLKFGRGGTPQMREELRHTMRECLYPSDPDWRDKCLSKGLDEEVKAYNGVVDWDE